MSMQRDVIYVAIIFSMIILKCEGGSSATGQIDTTSDIVQSKVKPHEETQHASNNEEMGPGPMTTGSSDRCQIDLQSGKNYFHSQLLRKEPHFVQFRTKQVENENHQRANNVFEPFRWSWTYKDQSGPLPFVSWMIHYGVLSFHLLETKTIYLEHEIELNVSKECNITYGSDETVEKIVNAFVPLINVTTGDDIPTYTESYFCYYQINPESTAANNIASHYLLYNTIAIENKCAVVYFNYTSKLFVVNTTCEVCARKNREWARFGFFPVVFAVLSLLYCSPIIVFSVAQWMTKHEKIIAHEVDNEYKIIGDPFENVNFETDIEDDWLYADGINHPLNISGVFSFDSLGLAAKYPIFIGRLRRFIFILLVPLFIYLQLIMFDQGMGMWKDKITVKSLVRRRVPLAFLSLLGDPENRQYCFAYWLGGPVGVTCLYYALSVLFVVLPRSLKQVVEDGLPSSKKTFKSPLFLTFDQTMRFSNVINKKSRITSGYPKAIMVIKCRFYMLFSSPFWQYVWTTQRARWSQVCSCTSTRVCF